MTHAGISPAAQGRSGNATARHGAGSDMSQVPPMQIQVNLARRQKGWSHCLGVLLECI